MSFAEKDVRLMRAALDAARAAGDVGEAPVGAVVADGDGEIIAAAGNAPIAHRDPTAHAEILAMRAAAEKIGNYRLTGLQLFATLEPCAMCAGAIAHARIERLVIGARDPKGGAVWHGPKLFEQPTCHWRPEVVDGPFADEAGDLLRQFFRARRK